MVRLVITRYPVALQFNRHGWPNDQPLQGPLRSRPGRHGCRLPRPRTPTLKRPVALNLAPHLLQDEEASKRFEREATAAAGLSHPNICTVVCSVPLMSKQLLLALLNRQFLDGCQTRSDWGTGIEQSLDDDFG